MKRKENTLHTPYHIIGNLLGEMMLRSFIDAVPTIVALRLGYRPPRHHLPLLRRNNYIIDSRNQRVEACSAGQVADAPSTPCYFHCAVVTLQSPNSAHERVHRSINIVRLTSAAHTPRISNVCCLTKKKYQVQTNQPHNQLYDGRMP